MNDEEMLIILSLMENDISCCRTEKEALRRAIDILEKREEMKWKSKILEKEESFQQVP